MDINIKPVAYVTNIRDNLLDDYWGDVVSEIELADDIPEESLDGIEDFSHLEIVFYFHLHNVAVVFSRYPRGNHALPLSGIFSQRNKDRPNHVGLTIAELVKREGRKIIVKHLDAVSGTPVIDIKPVMRPFLADKSIIRQPSWVDEMLKDYWEKA